MQQVLNRLRLEMPDIPGHAQPTLEAHYFPSRRLSLITASYRGQASLLVTSTVIRADLGDLSPREQRAETDRAMVALLDGWSRYGS